MAVYDCATGVFEITRYDAYALVTLPPLSVAVTVNVCTPRVLVLIAAPFATVPAHVFMPLSPSLQLYDACTTWLGV
jgi:hypothetical protein